MIPGVRQHGSASALVRLCDAFPAGLRSRTREIARFLVPEADRGHGAGSTLLRQICGEADRARLVLVLRPETDRLAEWYARHGFETVQTIPAHIMARAPA